jgi:hypothetical protein
MKVPYTPAFGGIIRRNAAEEGETPIEFESTEVPVVAEDEVVGVEPAVGTPITPAQIRTELEEIYEPPARIPVSDNTILFLADLGETLHTTLGISRDDYLTATFNILQDFVNVGFPNYDPEVLAEIALIHLENDSDALISGLIVAMSLENLDKWCSREAAQTLERYADRSAAEAHEVFCNLTTEEKVAEVQNIGFGDAPDAFFKDSPSDYAKWDFMFGGLDRQLAGESADEIEDLVEASVGAAELASGTRRPAPKYTPLTMAVSVGFIGYGVYWLIQKIRNR